MSIVSIANRDLRGTNADHSCSRREHETQERALANYMLRTRRPELFGELLRDQGSA